jgi:hypothetical protein
MKESNENIELSNIGGMGPLLLPTATTDGSGDILSKSGDADDEYEKKRKEFKKGLKTFEQFINENIDKLPDEITNSDGIVFQKQKELSNKKSTLYFLYYRGYDIDFGGHRFDSMNSLQSYMDNRIVSNSQYNKLKHMPIVKIGSKESKSLYESSEKIIDYSNAKAKILVGLKTNLLRDMKDRYDFKEDGDNIYFFNDKRHHFGTLFDVGTRYQELRNDGSIDDYGWMKK